MFSIALHASKAITVKSFTIAAFLKKNVKFTIPSEHSSVQ